VELDEEGNPKKRSVGSGRRPQQAPARGGRKPPPRRKVPVTVIPGVAAATVAAEDVEIDDVDVADAAPAETRPASAPRRRPVGRSTGAPRRG